MKTTDIDLLLDDVRRTARRAVADDCAGLDRDLAVAIRRRRRPYEFAATALPLALIVAILFSAPAMASVPATSVDCNNDCTAVAVMADADAVINAWLRTVEN